MLDLGAIQSQCTADGDRRRGRQPAHRRRLSCSCRASDDVDLVALPTNPPPNTKLLTDLDEVVDRVSDALETELDTGPHRRPGAARRRWSTRRSTPSTPTSSRPLADQLGPLEDNVLDVTLNKQTRGARSIEVTALDLRLLPAASAFVDLLNIEIGRSLLRPQRRAGVPTPPDPDPHPGPDARPRPPTRRPAVPTSVPAGEFDAGRCAPPTAAPQRPASPPAPSCC